MLDNLHSTLLPWNGVGEGKIILVSICRTSCWMVLLVGCVRFLLLIEAFIIVPTLFPTVDTSSSLCSMICSSVNVSSSIAAANSRFSLQSSHKKTWRFRSSRAVASIKCSFPGPRTVFLKLCFFRCIAVLQSLTFVFFSPLSAIRDWAMPEARMHTLRVAAGSDKCGDNVSRRRF